MVTNEMGRNKLQELRAEAVAAAVAGDLAEAVRLYEHAIDLCRRSEDQSTLSDLWGELGDVQAELGEVRHAIECFKRALELDSEHHDSLGKASAYRRLGAAYQEEGDLDRAAEAYSDAERLLESTEASDSASRERCILYRHWGMLYADQGQYRRALGRYQDAVRMGRSLNDPAEAAACLRYQAAVLHQLGDVERATCALEEARTVITSQPSVDRPELIEVMTLHGAILEDQGQMAKSLELYGEALKEARRRDLGPAQARVLRHIGSALAVRGEFERALDSYQEAIDICKRLDDQPELSRLYGDVGDVYAELGQIQKAIDSYKDALYLDLDHKDSLGKAIGQRRLGAAYQEKGDFDRAEEAYREADRIFEREELDDDGEKAVLLTNWGSLREAQGRFREALKLYGVALDINTAQRNDVGRAICMRYQASALHQQGHNDEAREKLQAVQEIFTRQGGEDRPELIETKLLLGSLLEDEGKSAGALELYEDALLESQRLNLRPAQGRALRCMGSALAQRGELDRAIDKYRDVIDICKRLDDQPELSSVYGDLGDALLELGRIDEAIDVFKRAQELDQNHRDLLGLAVAHRRLGSAYVEKGDFVRSEEAFQAAERIFEDEGVTDDTEKASFYISWGSLRESQGRFRDALKLYDDAQTIYSQQRNAVGVALSRRHKASVMIATNELANARAHLEAAGKLLEGQGAEDRPELIAVKNLLGNVLLEQGDVDGALDVFDDTVRESQRLALGPARIDSLRHYASGLLRRSELSQNDLVRAADRLAEALQIAEELRDDVAKAEILDDLGDVHYAAGQINEALRHYTDGRRLARRLDRSVLQADILLGLARCYRRQSKPDSVRTVLDEANEVLAEIEGTRELTRARLTLELAQLDEQDGKEDQAIQLYQRALEIFERTNDVKGALECHELLVRAHTRQRNLSQAGIHLAVALDETDPCALWTAMLERLDPRIVRAARASFSDGRYQHAVQSALTACELEIRSRCEADSDVNIEKLVRAWFSANGKGANEVEDESVESGDVAPRLKSRQGFAPWPSARTQHHFGDVWLGVSQSVRTALSHDTLPMAPMDAFSWLATAHLLLTYLDPPVERPRAVRTV